VESKEQMSGTVEVVSAPPTGQVLVLVKNQ
jgi:hypothetical protein